MRLFDRRIYWGVAGVILSFMPLLLVAFISLDQLIREQRELISVNSEELVKAERLRYLNSTLSSIMPVYVLSGDTKLLQRFRDQFNQFDHMTADLAASESDAKDLLDSIQQLSHRLRDLAQPGIEMRKKGASIEAVNDYFQKNTALFSGELQTLLNNLVNKETNELEMAKLHSAQTANWIIISIIALSAASILLLSYIARLITKAVRQKRLADETQDLLLQNELRLSQARKETVEVVAHDLKNPLSTIRMSLEMIQEDGSSTEEGLQIALRSAESMERLIKDLLDHAKIEAGQLVIEKTDGDLGALVSDLTQRFEPLAKNKNISFSKDIKGRFLFAHFDSSRIEQVISNLIGNALKFTHSGGRIHVSLKSIEDEILFHVEDNGPGIHPNQLPHVFDRFWQVKETAKNGNGLGLAIAKAIIEAHNGKIGVESQIGKGSRFFFHLSRLQLSRGPLREISKSQSPHDSNLCLN